MNEFEKKVMLTQGEYNFLIKRAAYNICLSRQVNYYYDTDDYEMNDQHITCRIREAYGRFVLTIKQHGHLKTERSLENSREVSDQWDNSRFTEKGLKFQGNLTTYRARIDSEYGIEAVLDRNLYLDKEDYELEVEYTDNYETSALMYIIRQAELLKKHGIIEDKLSFLKRMGMGKSKSERFFDRKKEIKLDQI